MSVLLIEDDPPLADALTRVLRRDGYSVDTSGSVRDACGVLDAKTFGVVVLDLGLPDLDGSEVVKHLRARGLDTPVLVLSARNCLEERIRLLDIGADDYLVKPPSLDEFLARVRALHRRRRTGARIVLGRLNLDIDGSRAYIDDHVLDLNSREWALLSFLAQTPGKVVPKEDISAALYGVEGDVSINALDQIMSRFRRRLADTGLNLLTVRGVGYYLEVDDGQTGA
jgi:two-component system, OmpR family, response regulator